MHRKAPVFNNSRPFNPVFSSQIPYSFCFLVLVVFNSSVKGFEDRTISYERERGSGNRALAQAGGAAAGAAAGAALGSVVPGVGTLIGGLIGGLFGLFGGGAAGAALIETETVTEVVGVDT